MNTKDFSNAVKCALELFPNESEVGSRPNKALETLFLQNFGGHLAIKSTDGHSLFLTYIETAEKEKWKKPVILNFENAVKLSLTLKEVGTKAMGGIDRLKDGSVRIQLADKVLEFPQELYYDDVIESWGYLDRFLDEDNISDSTITAALGIPIHAKSFMTGLKCCSKMAYSETNPTLYRIKIKSGKYTDMAWKLQQDMTTYIFASLSDDPEVVRPKMENFYED